jgi:hypothetical protein
MPDDYAYPIAQCDVTTEKRAALESYLNDENNGLNNSLLAEALLDGHVATRFWRYAG